jgi:RNA polymerase sigma factor (sigma-70 family)
MEASALRAGIVRRPRIGTFPPITGDARLVELIRAGSADAFEALYDGYHRQILSFCRQMLGSPEEAEDAVQQTFMAAYNDLVRSDKAIKLRPWLYTIARNHCYSMLRARREHASIEDVEPSVEGLAAEVQRRQDLRDLLRDLARLPEDQREALVLSELGSLSHDEIATVIGCPQGKVKALVFQARSSLAASREAREVPCTEIREDLATLSGGALRRTMLRRHVRECPGCREFEAEVKRQRKQVAALLPVVPTAGLKAGLMSGLAAKTGAAGGAGIAAAGAGAGGGAVGAGGGLSAVLANAGAAKLAVAGVLAVGGIGGTVAAVNAVDGSSSGHAPAPASHRGQGGATSTATPSGVTPTRPFGERSFNHAGGVANGKNAKGERGRSRTAPGRAGTAPGQARRDAGRGGRTNSGNGRATAPPGRYYSSPGRSGTSPGQTRAPLSRSLGRSRTTRGTAAAVGSGVGATGYALGQSKAQ